MKEETLNLANAIKRDIVNMTTLVGAAEDNNLFLSDSYGNFYEVPDLFYGKLEELTRKELDSYRQELERL